MRVNLKKKKAKLTWVLMKRKKETNKSKWFEVQIEKDVSCFFVKDGSEEECGSGSIGRL